MEEQEPEKQEKKKKVKIFGDPIVECEF